MNERIYDLYLGLLAKLPFLTCGMKNAVIKIFIFLLGNAVLEFGFSINEQMLEINMKEQSQWFRE